MKQNKTRKEVYWERESDLWVVEMCHSGSRDLHFITR